MILVRAVFLAVLFCATAWAQTATITPAASTYSSAGGAISFAVEINYAEPVAAVSSIGVSMRAPTGWAFASAAGPHSPGVIPPVGTTGLLEFAFTSVPANPVQFSFTLNYAAGRTGDQAFTNGTLIFRSGGTREIAIPNFMLTPGGSSGPDPTTVAPTITAQPVSLSLPEGQGATFSVTVTGTPPLTYQWRKDGAPLAGVTTASLVFSSVNAASAGTYSVVISNSAGSATSAGATLAVTAKPVFVPPQIIVQPRDAVTTPGAAVTLSVTASGTAPLVYEWRKNGAVVIGATTNSLTLSGQATDAGTYTVAVSNSGGAVTSIPATVTVSSAPLPAAIGTHPVAQTAATGGAVSFSVVATGTGALTYQWQKDGAVIAGATNSTLSLTNIAASAAGNYRVVVTNSVGSATSNAAALSVNTAARRIDGIYFGSFANNGGAIALLVRSDRTGVFLGFASGLRVALVSREVVIDAAGRFSITQPDPRGTAGAASGGGEPPTAAHEGEFHIEGTIAADGTLSGTVSGLNLTFAAPVAASSGSTAGVAGFYQSGAVGSSAQSYAIVSPAGPILVVNAPSATADGGLGTVAANGAIAVRTAANATVTGSVTAENATMVTTVVADAATPVTFVGSNNDARTDIEKLINISTRSQTGTAANTLIAGFVITGDAAKPVLVRAIGPTLGTAFNVGGALSAARLEIFRGQTSIAVGNDWGSPATGAPSAATIAAATTRVGAFGLPASSRDASLLLTLEPGAYTAVVTGQGGASGVSLVEVYDATDGAIPRSRRIINIATRATAGTGDSALIAGFYVSGTVPKRLLIRGVGPALTQFGVAGVLARPQLTVNSGATVVTQNAGWSTAADATAIAASSAQVGAFAFPAASQDAALIVHLLPGAYTAQVSGVGNTSGVALIEVYELP